MSARETQGRQGEEDLADEGDAKGGWGEGKLQLALEEADARVWRLGPGSQG